MSAVWMFLHFFILFWTSKFYVMSINFIITREIQKSKSFDEVPLIAQSDSDI